MPAHARLVPVYCRVVQRSAVLWRQIAVGGRSTDHSDPKQLPDVLQGRQRQTDVQQAGCRRQDPNCYRGSFLLSSSPRFVTFSFLIPLVPSLGTFPLSVKYTLRGVLEVCAGMAVNDSNLTGHNCGCRVLQGCKRSESRTGKRQR